MAKKKAPPADGDKIPQKKSTNTKRRVREHISDKNDIITDDDIKSSRIDIEEVKEEIEKKETELENNAEVNEGNEAGGKKKVTPWDVLDNKG
jgi:hypothetical protein